MDAVGDGTAKMLERMLSRLMPGRTLPDANEAMVGKAGIPGGSPAILGIPDREKLEPDFFCLDGGLFWRLRFLDATFPHSSSIMGVFPKLSTK